MASNRISGEGTSNPSGSTGRGQGNEHSNPNQGNEQHKGKTAQRISLMDAMKRRIEEAEKAQHKKQKALPMCRFGKNILPMLPEEDPRGFRPLEGLPVDQQQKCLLDAIWRARNTKEKLEACCSLQYYLSKIMEPPAGKNYSYYTLLNGPYRGIYCYYSSLLHAKEGLTHPQYKGFYSFTDALNSLWDKIYDKNSFIYIEEQPREGPLIENYQVELRALKDQVNDLLTEIAELKKPSEGSDDILMSSPDMMTTEAIAQSLLEEAEGRNPRNFRR